MDLPLEPIAVRIRQHLAESARVHSTLAGLIGPAEFRVVTAGFDGTAAPPGDDPPVGGLSV